MRLVRDAGLWATGAAPEAGPLALVLEVSGAVLSWTVDGDRAEPPVIAFTDVRRADWLWRVFGEGGHVALVEELERRAAAQSVGVDGLSVLPGSTDTLRRLAFGHWLRRWWPASVRDAIAPLDRAVLDVELAVLTAAADAFFTDDGFDADLAGLLAPHVAMMDTLAAQGDPRVTELIDGCRDLAEDLGLAHPEPVVLHRDDYALAASGGGVGSGADPSAIATGVASVPWSSVPPGIFDAADNTVDWTVRYIGDVTNVVVQAELSGPDSPSGIDVVLHCGSWRAAGVFDAVGRATLPVFDMQGEPVGEGEAWNADWSSASLRVGVGRGEPAGVRDRVRALVRTRLAEPGVDAFLAEVLAAEADY